MQNKERPPYSRLTPKMMVQLAAPHTWPASIFPVLFSVAYAALALSRHIDGGFLQLSPSMVVVLLLISILFQSAVNTINDYFDFRNGADTVDNQDDPTDAVLVYNNVRPRSVLAYFLCLVASAFLLGIYCIWAAGVFPLVVALVGIFVILAYSGGRTPISYLPIGEAVSGLTMGYLIPVASIYCMLSTVEANIPSSVAVFGSVGSALPYFGSVLLFSLPIVFSIALIMFTNNACDIPKDSHSGRRTLAVLLGHDRAVSAYHGLMLTWLASVVIDAVLVSWRLWPLLPFTLLLAAPLFAKLWANPLLPQTRGAAFGQCTSLNIALNSLYLLMLFAGATV